MYEVDVVDEVMFRVSEFYGVSVAALQGELRSSRIQRARQIGMYLAHRMSGETPQSIGARFGGRDYTSVLLAWRAIDRARIENDQLRGHLEGLEYAIKRRIRYT